MNDDADADDADADADDADDDNVVVVDVLQKRFIVLFLDQ
jgi:hypothetical protein